MAAKTSEYYKEAQNIQISSFINAGKIVLLEAVQQDADAAMGSGRQLKACRTAGASVEETTARMLLAGVAVLDAKARETHERFRQVVKDDRASDQAQDMSDEPEGNKLS